MASVRTQLWFGNNQAVQAANFYAEQELSGDYTSLANQRVCQAMLQMGRIEFAELQAADEAPDHAP